MVIGNSSFKKKSISVKIIIDQLINFSENYDPSQWYYNGGKIIFAFSNPKLD